MNYAGCKLTSADSQHTNHYHKITSRILQTYTVLCESTVHGHAWVGDENSTAMFPSSLYGIRITETAWMNYVFPLSGVRILLSLQHPSVHVTNFFDISINDV